MSQKLGLLKRMLMSDEEIEDYNKKNLITLNGECVKSQGERIIANFLYNKDIDYIYERRLKYNNRVVIPDFLLPSWEHHVIIEYWGMNRESYHKRRKVKQRLYKNHCPYNLIDVFPHHLKTLEDYLTTMIDEKKKGWFHL
ncbi:hypothetical protein HQ489_04540 [Candidatus Woesearchaeota archaeon]|nr:hypothetical protein [Candidatus Woesearchaeota archaeon]